MQIRKRYGVGGFHVLSYRSLFAVAWAFVLLLPLLSSAQRSKPLNAYQEAIRTLDPMDTGGLEPKLAHLLEQYYEWTFGGVHTWKQVQSVRFDGLLHLPNGTARFVAFKKRPDLCKVVVFTGGNNRMVMAYDGVDAWKITSTATSSQPVDMLEKEAADFIRDATIAGHLHYPAMEGKQIELMGIEEVDDRPCYKLALTLPEGARIVTYLDSSNFAERRQETTNSLTGLVEQTTFSDFRTLDGVRFPFASVMKSGGELTHRIEIERIQTNLGVMPWMFQRPSGASIPGESEEGKGMNLFEGSEGESGLPPFGPPAPGETAFPDPEPADSGTLLENLGKPNF